MLLLDKPAGVTSNAALQTAKRLLRARKAGHAGTLDPLASGLLPVLFGEATKFSAYLLEADKRYAARIVLGISTSTGDAEGEVIERRAVSVTDAQVEGALARFRGRIEQIPPMFSALKHAGQPLYRLARRGIEIDRAPRTAEIRELRLVARDAEAIEIDVRCSKGTYVRTLAEDIGRALGTGAHIQALRRTASGGCTIEQAVPLADLAAMDEDQRMRVLHPVDLLLRGLPRLELAAHEAGRLRTGQPALRPGSAAGRYALYASGALLGVGQAEEDGRIRPLRLTADPSHGATG